MCHGSEVRSPNPWTGDQEALPWELGGLRWAMCSACFCLSRTWPSLLVDHGEKAAPTDCWFPLLTVFSNLFFAQPFCFKWPVWPMKGAPWHRSSSTALAMAWVNIWRNHLPPPHVLCVCGRNLVCSARQTGQHLITGSGDSLVPSSAIFLYIIFRSSLQTCSTFIFT